MPVTSKPPRLQRGDVVALVAPASGQKRADLSLVTQATKLLQSWGLTVIQTPTLRPTPYLSADDSTRSADLRHALTAPDIKAIFVTRGGYGCARLLASLTDIIVPTPRLLLGFSDITTLHLHFMGQRHLYAVHAPNLATHQFLADTVDAATNRSALQQLLFQGIRPLPTLTPLYPQVKINDMMRLLNTPLTGGCLSLLTTSLGTAHEIQTQGKTLLIEEVGEAPYKIDRQLTHLKNAGKLDELAGLIIGDMVQCDSPSVSLQEVLQDVLSSLDCPIFHTADFGHGTLNLPWFYDRSFILGND